MTLYELTDDYLTLLSMVDDPDVDEQTLLDTMEGIKGELEDKAVGYAKVMKNMEAEAAGLKAEIDRLTSRKRAIDNNVARMKTALQQSMILTGQTDIKTDLFSFKIQKNPAAVVMDEQYIENIPEKFLTYHEPTVNRAAIKDALKAGENLDGIAHLEQSESLRIR